MLRMMLLLGALLFFCASQAAIVIGNPKGTVTLVEVFDYQCPHCQKMAPIVDALIRANPQLKVRLLPVAIEKNQLGLSLYQAAAAIAATHYDHAFATFHAINMAQHPVQIKQVTLLLKQMKVFTPKFEKRMHSQSVKDQMNEGLAYLEAMHSGTPLFIIYPSNHSNVSQVLEGEQTLHALQQVIDHAKTYQ